MNNYIECGVIANTHGINGAIKVMSYCDTPEMLASLPKVYLPKLGNYKEYKVLSSSVYKEMVIFSLEGVDSIDTATLLKNKTLFALRDDFHLEDDEYFIADTIGTDVIDANTGKNYGKVVSVNTNGPQNIFEVQTENGIKYLPDVPVFIKEVKPFSMILVTPIPGLLDDDSESIR